MLKQESRHGKNVRVMVSPSDERFFMSDTLTCSCSSREVPLAIAASPLVGSDESSFAIESTVPVVPTPFWCLWDCFRFEDPILFFLRLLVIFASDANVGLLFRLFNDAL